MALSLGSRGHDRYRVLTEDEKRSSSGILPIYTWLVGHLVREEAVGTAHGHIEDQLENPVK